MIIETSKQASEIQHILERPAWYKALTLMERVALLRTHKVAGQQDGDTFDSEQAARRLQDWKLQPPFNKEPYFAERLERDDVTEEELLLLLGETDKTGFQRLDNPPDWLQELALAYGALPEDYSAPPPQEKASTLEEQQIQLARFFITFASPLIDRGMRRLNQGIEALLLNYPSPPFDLEAIKKLLAANLAGLLLPAISRTLTLELHVARLEERLTGETPQERFQSFIQQLRQKNVVLPLLEEYAPLARIMVTKTDHWVSANLEFLQRLCADWDEICRFFSPDQDPGSLVEVSAGAGDQHRGGRSTCILKFASGFRILYKPRSLAIDVHFQQLLTWLNERGDYPPFRTLQILDKGAYGWTEFVDSPPCSSLDEVACFYKRQGAYLALFYVLEATDFHAENLIASGEHPMMIDLESLFHPQLNRLMPMTVSRRASETIANTVFRVGLLPQRVWGNRNYMGVDASGLGWKEGQMSPRPVLQTKEPGTDQMRFIRERIKMEGKSNRPMFDGQYSEAQNYSAEIVDGFSQMYWLLMRECEALQEGPLQSFVHDETRLILRGTNTYAQLLYESYHPDLLRDTLERDRFFDRLWTSIEYRPYLKQCIAAEQADLHAGDIPFFSTSPGTRDIFTSRGECLSDYLVESSIEQVKKNLRQLSTEDLTRQIWVIKASLLSILMEKDMFGTPQAQAQTPSTQIQGEVTTERLLQAACAVGDRLCELAFVGEYGANWLGLTFAFEREWIVLPADIGVYSGVSGVALFLAYLGKITSIEKYTLFARSALQFVQGQIYDENRDLKTLGGFGGWSSIIYLYTHLGALWQDQTLWQQAEDLTKHLPELIDKDETLDAIGGSAGTLFTLLSLYRVHPSAVLLTVAMQCGDRLLSRADQCQESQPEKDPPVKRPLTGFSHGAAGMALCLLQLAEVSGQERFRQGAIAAMNYERGVFSPEKQNWPDFREIEGLEGTFSDGNDQYMVAWCHGAPGIGLARLASLSHFDDVVIRDEIDVALETTLNYGFEWNHSLCHGAMGNLETVLLAGQILGDASYQEKANRTAAMILDNITKQGWLTGVPLRAETPGLMTGIAGIGYELLRLADPEKVPSVLLLAPPNVS